MNGIKFKMNNKKGNKAIKKKDVPALEVNAPFTIPIIYISNKS